MAPQLMGTKGLSARRELACSARTRSSLPVPDSPVTSTVLSVGATLASTLKTSSRAGLRPMIPLVSMSMRAPAAMSRDAERFFIL